ESSFDAWIKYYRPDEDSINSQQSYYSGGALLALCMDAKLRNEGYSLDLLMQQIWSRYHSNPMPEDAIAHELLQLTGRPWNEFLTRYVEHANEPPMEEAFELLGMWLSWRLSKSPQDLSGPVVGKNSPPVGWHHLGLELSAQNVVQKITQGSSAFTAGINVGDELIALNNYRINTSLTELQHLLHPGQELKLLIARDACIQNKIMLIQPLALDTACLLSHASAHAEQLAHKQQWLASL
ncbi:MAG: hypothetical protein RLZZ502_1705, partial [Pseudomonadota bacterium]